jgi:hypothetical protein
MSRIQESGMFSGRKGGGSWYEDYTNNKDNLNGHDRRQTKGRFGWVKRLMQGQNRNQNGTLVSTSNMTENNGYANSRVRESRGTGSSQRSQSFSGGESYEYNTDNDVNGMDQSEEIDSSNDNHEARSTTNSDQLTTQSENDNISTIPLKSMTSASTKSPSVLSTNQDNNSYVASTAETSLAPSIHANSVTQTLNPNSQLQLQTYDRDSESIVTLASSSRRTRRRSLETNSSTAGIPPASIMERLAIHPNAASSTYTASIHNANDRTSIYNGNMGVSQSSVTDSNDQANSVN